MFVKINFFYGDGSKTRETVIGLAGIASVMPQSHGQPGVIVNMINGQVFASPDDVAALLPINTPPVPAPVRVEGRLKRPSKAEATTADGTTSTDGPTATGGTGDAATGDGSTEGTSTTGEAASTDSAST